LNIEEIHRPFRNLLGRKSRRRAEQERRAETESGRMDRHLDLRGMRRTQKGARRKIGAPRER
jgi:hypothetical protein